MMISGATFYLQVSSQHNLSLEDMEVEALFEKGEYYFNHSDEGVHVYDLEKARLYYTELIRRDPTEHPLVWYQLGRMDFIEGYFDDAIFKFEKQKVYFPDSGVILTILLGLPMGTVHEAGELPLTGIWPQKRSYALLMLFLMPHGQESIWHGYILHKVNLKR